MKIFETLSGFRQLTDEAVYENNESAKQNHKSVKIKVSVSGFG